MVATWRARPGPPGPRERAEAYVRHLLAPPPTEAARWLEALGVPVSVAAREVAWAIRAVGLIVAARDALDDRTAAEVSHALDRALAAGDPVTGDGTVTWRQRQDAYLQAHGARGTGEPVARRLARVLLQGAGVHTPTTAALDAAVAALTAHRMQLNAELGQAFGVASLPDDLPPSSVAQGRPPGAA